MDSLLGLIDKKVIPINVDLSRIIKFFSRFDDDVGLSYRTHFQINRIGCLVGEGVGDLVMTGGQNQKHHERQNQVQAFSDSGVTLIFHGSLENRLIDEISA